MRIDKKSIMDVIHRERPLSDMFVAFLLTRNIRHEEDLVDQLFNSSEKRSGSAKEAKMPKIKAAVSELSSY
jgi:hypothetical protein